MAPRPAAPALGTPRRAASQPEKPFALVPEARGISGPMLAFLLSLGWLVALVAVFAAGLRQGRPLAEAVGLVITLLAVFLPIVLIWLSVLVLRAVQAMQAQALRLEAATGRMRHHIDAMAETGRAEGPLPGAVSESLAALAEAQRQTEARLALFVSRRDEHRHAAGTPESTDQRGLALDTPRPPAKPLAHEELARALDFPRNASDAEGFELLRRALHDHASSDLLRAAQEVLTGLAEEGVEIDDLAPDRARPEFWRAFAQGARGPEIAPLGAVRDRSVLALTASRMRQDPVFRSAAHSFLRAFDRRFASFAATASDADIARLADTRSARAFMILGRVTGMFG